MAYVPPRLLTVESNDNPDMISASLASRYLKHNSHRAFVAMTMPFEIPDPNPDPDPDLNPENTPVLATINAADLVLEHPVPVIPTVSGTKLPDLAHVSPHIQKQLKDLFEDFPDIFSESPLAGGALVDTLEHTPTIVLRFSPVCPVLTNLN